LGAECGWSNYSFGMEYDFERHHAFMVSSKNVETCSQDAEKQKLPDYFGSSGTDYLNVFV